MSRCRVNDRPRLPDRSSSGKPVPGKDEPMHRLTCLFCLLIAPAAVAQDKRPIQIDDLFRFKRIADPQITPDGKWVAYVVGVPDLAANKIPASIWLAPTDKGEPKQLTVSPKSDRHPRWSPDGKQILFESNRTGTNQLWLIDVAGGEPRQLTT